LAALHSIARQGRGKVGRAIPFQHNTSLGAWFGEDRATRGVPEHGRPCTAATVTTPERLSTGGRFGIAPERLPPFSVVMTYYPYMHDPDDTLDEAYMRWLDKNGFPGMRSGLD
jgi:hypothetical protein